MKFASAVASRQPSEQGRRHRPDYLLVVLTALLLGVGLVVMYAISPALIAPDGANPVSYYVGRQAIAIVLGFLAFMAIAAVPHQWWRRAVPALFISGLLLCVLTIVIGGSANRWLQLGGFSFQPAELLKLVLIVGLASFLVDRIRQGELHSMQRTLTPILKVLGATAFVIVVLQRDLGSMLVITAIAAVMMLVARVPIQKLIGFSLLIVLAAGIVTAATPYRRDRMLTFFQPERDCLNEGYHACQALIAVGTGGLKGLGLGRSIQASGYLPEAANDSIFAIYAEMFGFIGSLLLLFLMGLLLLRMLHIAEYTADSYGRLLVIGIVTWLAVQSAMNIGAMIGILPLKGITLPFISYGGSSIILAMAAMGLVFRLSRYTQFRKVLTSEMEGASYANSGYGRGVRRPYYANSGRR